MSAIRSPWEHAASLLVPEDGPADIIRLDDLPEWLRSPARMAEHLTRYSPTPYKRAPLYDFIDTKLVQATYGKGKRFKLIEVPRQFGKSTLVSKWWPAWVQELHARRAITRGKFVLGTHSDGFARAWGGEARDVLTMHPSDLTSRVSPGSEAKDEWSTRSGAGLVARGVGGSLTGRTIHYLGIDDPLKAENCDSPTARDKAWDWWVNVASPALHPDAPVVVASCRYHEDDVAGRIRDPDREGDPDDWEIITIPAIAGADDPLGRREGEPLRRPDTEHDEATAMAFLRGVQRTSGPYAFSAQYQQEPQEPSGTIFRRGWWKFWRADVEPPSGNLAHAAFLDCAFKDTASSSFVVMAVWSYQRTGNRRWLVDLVRARLDFTATKLLVRAARQAYPELGTIVVEDKANGTAVVNDLSSTVAGLEAWDPSKYGSKEARAHAVSGEVQAGDVWIPEAATESGRLLREFRVLAGVEGIELPRIDADWVGPYISELGDFPNGNNDDQVDVTTGLLLWLRERLLKPATFANPASRRLEGVRQIRATR